MGTGQGDPLLHICLEEAHDLLLVQGLAALHGVLAGGVDQLFPDQGFLGALPRLADSIDGLMQGFPVEDGPVQDRNGDQVQAEGTHPLKAIAQLLQLGLPFFHQLKFPWLQREQLWDQQLLRGGGHLTAVELLVQPAFVGGVLVDKIQVVPVLDDPIGVEGAADDVDGKVQGQRVLFRPLGRRSRLRLPIADDGVYLYASLFRRIRFRRFLLREGVVGVFEAALFQDRPRRHDHLLFILLHITFDRLFRLLQLVIGHMRRKGLALRLSFYNRFLLLLRLNDLWLGLFRQLYPRDHRLPQRLSTGGGHSILHPGLVHEPDLCLGRVDVHVHLLLGNGDAEQGEGVSSRHHAGIIGLLDGGKQADGFDIAAIDEQGLHGPVGPGDLLVPHKALHTHIAVVQQHRQQPIGDLSAVNAENSVFQLAVSIGFIYAFSIAQEAEGDVGATQNGSSHKITDISRLRTGGTHELQPRWDLGKEVIHLDGGPEYTGAGLVGNQLPVVKDDPRAPLPAGHPCGQGHQ